MKHIRRRRVVPSKVPGTGTCEILTNHAPCSRPGTHLVIPACALCGPGRTVLMCTTCHELATSLDMTCENCGIGKATLSAAISASSFRDIAKS